VSASWWIALTGLGVYLAYVPFNSILFDRLLTATRRVGTASFLIYVADASGYAATVALYLGRLFGLKGVSWTQLTMMLASGLAWVSPVLLALAWLGLKRQRQAAG
jgi:hypothetical protein